MNPGLPILKRIHAKRLREMYRSAGWPYQDVVEIELLAVGLLERITATTGHESVRVTDAGIAYLAQAAHSNRSVLSAHEALVDLVAQTLLRDGRIVWKNLSLRAWLPPQVQTPGQWKITKPDVFSIRNSSVQAYRASKGRDCQALTSSRTASVTEEIRVGETSAPYISCR